MKLLSSLAVLGAALSSGIHAYPSLFSHDILGKKAIRQSISEAFDSDFLKRAGVPALTEFPDNFGLANEGRPYIFDERLQHVDTINMFKWKAPGPNDQRGPCAGLNALSNHGLISRDGILRREIDIFGISNGTGLSIGATTLLFTTTLLFDGDPLTGRFSIGGYDPRVSEGGLLGGDLLGRPSGLCGLGHLKSESDASITRGDFTQPNGENNNCRSYSKFFKELIDLARQKYPDSGHITPSIMAAHQHNRKLHSISHNPNYFAPAFGGLLFTTAAHHFVPALMSSKSAEHPEGYMSPEDLMSWFSYTVNAHGELIQKHGYERIPASFYKRHPTQQWTIVDILLANVQQILVYPKTSEIGGNTGKVNSFAGINIGDLTGGLFTSIQDLSNPTKLGCFLSQIIQAEAPSFTSRILQGPLLQDVLDYVGTILLPTLVETFGECNEVLHYKGKPMSHYKDQYPGLTITKNDEYSPAPGT